MNLPFSTWYHSRFFHISLPPSWSWSWSFYECWSLSWSWWSREASPSPGIPEWSPSSKSPLSFTTQIFTSCTIGRKAVTTYDIIIVIPSLNLTPAGFFQLYFKHCRSEIDLNRSEIATENATLVTSPRFFSTCRYCTPSSIILVMNYWIREEREMEKEMGVG